MPEGSEEVGGLATEPLWVDASQGHLWVEQGEDEGIGLPSLLPQRELLDPRVTLGLRRMHGPLPGGRGYALGFWLFPAQKDMLLGERENPGVVILMRIPKACFGRTTHIRLKKMIRALH